MDSDLQWIVTEVDGKIASVSTDYRLVARIMASLAERPARNYSEIRCRKISTEDLFALSGRVRWEDLLLFGTPFQISVWKKLFEITHGGTARLLSYVDFADSLGKASAVRAVAHAVGLNPVNVIIPCHLIIPKESVERLHDLDVEGGLFKWETLYMVDGRIDYGNYSAGPDIKRRLIRRHLALP